MQICASYMMFVYFCSLSNNSHSWHCQLINSDVILHCSCAIECCIPHFYSASLCSSDNSESDRFIAAGWPQHDIHTTSWTVHVYVSLHRTSGNDTRWLLSISTQSINSSNWKQNWGQIRIHIACFVDWSLPLMVNNLEHFCMIPAKLFYSTNWFCLYVF